MDNDFSVLASRIASSVGGLRGCVIVSRDGLVLGSYPDDGESLLRPAWLRFAALGDAERGFVEFAGELWVYAQRGPYAAFAVAGPNSRPGLILEELENVLLTAEEARTRREGVAPLDMGSRSKPRTPLHPGPVGDRPAAEAPAEVAPAPQVASSPGTIAPEPMVMPDAEAAAAAAGAEVAAMQQVAAQQAAQRAMEDQRLQEQLAAAQAAQAASEAAAAQQAAQAAAQQAAPPAQGQPQGQGQAGSDPEVDRVMLAQEFSQLLEESGYDDDLEE